MSEVVQRVRWIPMPSSAARGFQFLLLTLAASAAMYVRSAVSPLQETMRIAFDLNDNQMALVQGPALAIPLVVAAIPLGLLVDRYSRVRLLLIFTVLSILGSLLTALAHNFGSLLAARCLVGLSATATGTAAFSLLADLCAPSQRGRATLVVAIGQFAGSSVAFALGGALLAMPRLGSNGWQLVMLWLTAPLALVIVSMLAMREPPRTELAISKPSVREAFGELWHYKNLIVPLLAGLVTIEIALQSALVWTAPALARSFALQPSRVGAIMAIGLLVSGIAGPIVGGTLADISQRAGGPRLTMTVLCAMALATIPAALFGVVSELAAASVLIVTFMAIITALLVMGTALFTIVVPNELRGLCLSIFASATLIFGVGLGPVGVSLLSGAIGGPVFIGKALSLVGVTAGIVAASTFAFGRSHFSRLRAETVQNP